MTLENTINDPPQNLPKLTEPPEKHKTNTSPEPHTKLIPNSISTHTNKPLLDYILPLHVCLPAILDKRDEHININHSE